MLIVRCDPSACTSGEYAFKDDGWEVTVTAATAGGKVPYRAFAYLPFCHGQKIGSCMATADGFSISASFKSGGLIISIGTVNGTVGLFSAMHPMRAVRAAGVAVVLGPHNFRKFNLVLVVFWGGSCGMAFVTCPLPLRQDGWVRGVGGLRQGALLDRFGQHRRPAAAGGTRGQGCRDLPAARFPKGRLPEHMGRRGRD